MNPALPKTLFVSWSLLNAMANGGLLQIGAANVELDGDDAQLKARARPGEYVVFTVSDTGAGISSETLPRIFEPFFTTKPNGRGTRLGLSTALTIVRGYGGFVNVETAPGRGARFDVYWPAHPHQKPTQ